MTHALSARTMPEFFAARYLSPGMKVYAALLIFVFLAPYAAGVYKGLGAFFGAIFPGAENLIPGVSSDALCMFIVALLTGVYLILGGYLATAITDFVQGIIMLAGVIVMAVALVSSDAVGGLGRALDVLRSAADADAGVTAGTLTSLFGGGNWSFLLLNILLTSFGTWALPQMASKFYAVKDESAIRRGTLIATVFALVIGCGAYFAGIFGHVVLDRLPEGGVDAVMPVMLTQIFGGEGNLGGNILLAVILVLLLSASMSTLAAIVLTSSSALSVDLAQTVKKDIKPKAQMAWTRVLCLVFVALSFLFANAKITVIVSIMSYSWGVVSGAFIGPFVLGLYKKGITRAGAWAGMLCGFGAVLVMTAVYTLTSPQLADGFYPAFQAASGNAPLFGVTAMGVSLVLTLAVSLFTKKYDEAHLARVFGTPEG
jgi:SSS family solute:Na+ symporter/sodium/proline symporter